MTHINNDAQLRTTSSKSMATKSECHSCLPKLVKSSPINLRAHLAGILAPIKALGSERFSCVAPLGITTQPGEPQEVEQLTARA